MSDKTFFRYLKTKDSLKIIIALAAGILLILIGLGGSGADTEEASLESELEELCSSVDGVGECKVLIYYKEAEDKYDSEKYIQSIAVVCDGADSVEVRYRLTELLSSFLGIGTNRVRIEKTAGK